MAQAPGGKDRRARSGRDCWNRARFGTAHSDKVHSGISHSGTGHLDRVRSGRARSGMGHFDMSHLDRVRSGMAHFDRAFRIFP